MPELLDFQSFPISELLGKIFRKGGCERSDLESARGVCAHLSALNGISTAIEHREIKVFVRSVDADKACIWNVSWGRRFSCVDGANRATAI